ncbi:uncharacterized protein BO80DRAFT_481970 [Aspergillus ibericus CBS 121593]|uniref:C2H2-type domain-containing protein n=1 Tax=Aspergillus ibericus CBS 121593 TaxID=1448316 RepID=A0A395GRN1_9EURO|nr:hypothetical protein BO80DRAFT_481970 [Aspergillus ibericus CBS 121593]RAK97628.1 hypothetical protein BO80DRAFT_481970 [Aspergillus ibericus CBS 121593]
MPWKAQTCRFCHKRYANKAGLRTHYERYIHRWRIPADGVHDVLRIEELLNGNYIDSKIKYQCPTCSKVIFPRRRFIQHVRDRRHYGDHNFKKKQPTTKRRPSWVLPFPEESVMVQTKPFPFFRLPYGQ